MKERRWFFRRKGRRNRLCIRPVEVTGETSAAVEEQMFDRDEPLVGNVRTQFSTQQAYPGVTMGERMRDMGGGGVDIL